MCICYFTFLKTIWLYSFERKKNREGEWGGERRKKKENSIIVGLTGCLRISLLNSHTWVQRFDKNVISLV